MTSAREATPAATSTRGVAARVAAWRAVRAVHARGAWSAPAVDAALREADLDARDRALAANLAFSTLRWEGTLDWALGHVLDRPLTTVEPEVADVLRLGAWQLLYGRAPARATVSTTVEVARAGVGPRATGFVNGVLRGLQRRHERLPWPPESSDEGLGLALGYPAWIVAQARDRFGRERARAVLEAGNDPPGLTLRAAGDRDALVAQLRAAGHDTQPGVYAPWAVRVPGADPARLPQVASGEATPQDEASMLVVAALLPAGGAGLRVADVCAGPGGKATLAAQLGAQVVAGDASPSRAKSVATSARRLGVADRVCVLAADGRAPALTARAFDAVLVDAPCTGLGAVRRRPDLRWRRQPGDAPRLGRMAGALLDAAAELVAPAGRLVYSVCTWTQAETVEVAHVFLALHGDRFTVAEPPATVAAAGRILPDDPGLQLGPAGVDGMYVLTLERRG